MKSIFKILLFTYLLLNSFFLFSQITITEIEKKEEIIVLKPEPYDSLKNWEYHEKLGEDKEYIGLQIYFPPRSNKAIGVFPESRDNFLFSIKPSIIKTNVKSSYEFMTSVTNEWGRNEWKEHVYDSLITFVYKPYQYYFGAGVAGELMVGVCSDSNSISNTYFTILNVFYAGKLRTILNKMADTLHCLEIRKNSNIYINKYRHEVWTNNGHEPDHIFLIRNEKTGDSLYWFGGGGFILVPYFVKQQNIFTNKYLIYDDVKEDWGSYLNPVLEENDTRFLIKYEGDNGEMDSSYKKVNVEYGSKWLCSAVTLLKPSYDIYYILKNDKDEQITLPNLDGFITEEDYLKRIADKKLQSQQLNAKQKLERLQREENERKVVEKRKAECISLFGQPNGILIAQGKVKINMTKDMCKYAWGVPFWTSKTTTVYGTFEDWYYWLGYSLHFENGLLIRIEE